MLGAKPCKVQDASRNARKGIVACSLAELKKKGVEKLRLRSEGCRVCIEDGTEVDDEEYFKTLPAQTIFVFVNADQEYEGYLTVLKNAIEKIFNIGMSERNKTIDGINKLIHEGDSEHVYGIMAEVANRLRENIDAEERREDKEWFDGLGERHKTKSEVLRYTAQSRMRNYLSKTKEFVDGNAIRNKRSTKLLLQALAYFKEKLKEEDYFGAYFVRRGGDESLKLCCDKGWFKCQGEYNVTQCSKHHMINPYGSKASRMLFSSWNLDHVIEKSREVLPALLTAAESCPEDSQLNTDYFFQLLFTLENLKLVNSACHDKTEHHGRKCNKKLLYKKL